MGYHHQGRALCAQLVHKLYHGPHAIDIHARVNLVQEGQAWLQQGQLQQFVALAFAAREAFIDRTRQHGLGQAELLRCSACAGQEVERIQRLLAPGFAHGVEGAADKQVVFDARDVRRRLERHKQPGACAFVRIHGQQILAVQRDLAGCDVVLRVACERQAQGALAAAVGAHQHHQGTRRHVERDGFKDVAVTDLHAQVTHLEQGVRGRHGVSFN